MSFDTLAPHYRWMEFVLAGNRLQRCRTAFLKDASNCRNALLVGEGNGRFLLECRRELAGASITCLDSSARMLAAAKTRIRRAGFSPDDVAFVHSDILAWTPPAEAFDLVVTNFFLDCFPPDQLARAVERIAAAATPQATWLLADFCLPAGGLGSYRAKAIHGLMYAFFRVATRLPARRLTVPDSFLQAHRFSRRERRLSEWRLLHADKWQRDPHGPGDQA